MTFSFSVRRQRVFEQLPAALSELRRPLDALAAVVLTHNEDAHPARDSVSRLKDVPASLVVATHGRPFEGPPPRSPRPAV